MHLVGNERHWIPAYAGMTVGILRPPQQRLLSLACDDRYVGGSHATRIPYSLPAKGCSGGFRPHAVCPRNGNGVLAITCPARGDPASLLFRCAAEPTARSTLAPTRAAPAHPHKTAQSAQRLRGKARREWACRADVRAARSSQSPLARPWQRTAAQ